MSDEQTSAPQADSNVEYSSDADGLRQAARDLVAERRAPHEDEIAKPPTALQDRIDRDGFNRGVTARDAAAELSKYRENQAEQQRAFDAALGVEDGGAEQGPVNEAAPEVAPPVDAPEAAQTEVDQIKQQAQAEIERARTFQDNLAKLGHVHAQQASLEHQFKYFFPDINTAQDLQQLLNTNETRGRQALEFLNQASDSINRAQQQTQQTLQQEQEHFNAQYSSWAKTQDKAFEARHPELKDPVAGRKLGELAAQELKSIGLSSDEITALYQGKASIALRDHRAQELVLDAVRWRSLQRTAHEKRAAPAPRVMKPGLSKPAPSAADSELSDLKAAAKQAPTVRNMARLLAAQRATR